MQDQEQDESSGAGDEQDQFDAMPEEMKRHMMAAFVHAAGRGPHPGKYAGPEAEEPHEKDDAEPSESDLQHAHEMGYSKMKDASQGLGLTPFDRQEIEQRNAIEGTQATQAAMQAKQAQGQQMPQQPPPAPSGAAGTTEPYAAQRGPQPPSNVSPLPPSQQEGGQP